MGYLSYSTVMVLVKAHHIFYSKPHKSKAPTRLFLKEFTYTPIYVKFFQVVTSSVYFPPEFYLLYLTVMLHTWLIYLSLILPFQKYLPTSTNYEAQHYVVLPGHR